MSLAKEKVSYLRGLFDGLELDEGTHSKLFAAMIDAMDTIADAIEDNEATIDELDECVSDIYDSIEELEEDLYGFLGDDDDDDDDDDDEYDPEDDEDRFVEVECPHCHDTIYFDSELLARGELICPSCNQPVLSPEESE